MKSLLIMFPGLGIVLYGFFQMWEQTNTSAGFAAAKPYYIVGGVILFIGMLVNHWEHTRRNG